MIKAEVITHEAYEVPNWLTKCKDVLVSGPAITALALVVVAGFGALVWDHGRPSYTDQSAVQSQPAGVTSLQVISADQLPAAPPVSSAIKSVGQETPSAAATPTPIGPAPASSLNSLQSTGAAQNNAGGLEQAVGQTIQSAGQATDDLVHNLGL